MPTGSGRPDVPPRISFVTLGAADVATLRRFYTAWGWTEAPDGTADFAQFLLENTRFALYRRDLLKDEAAPDLSEAGPGSWSGITLAINVRSRDQVDSAFAAAVRAGAAEVAAPVSRDWGGYSGYVGDPEGNRWEIAWLPGYDLDPAPSTRQPPPR